MDQTIGLAIFFGAFLLMLFIIFIKANLVICQPNEVVIISGRRRKLPDGSIVGYRIIKGGRGFKWPILESVKRLPLNTIPLDIHLKKALSRGIIPIDVDGRANVKIAGTEAAGLSNAIERFLGKNLNEIANVARETIEGSLRGIIANVTPEDANTNRLELAEEVAVKASTDLAKLGLVLDFVKIQNISDSQGYLEAIGRKKTAEVLRNAKIAEAKAESEARVVAAAEKQKGVVAEVEAEMTIVDAQNKFNVHRSALEAQSNEAAEKAKVAGQIMRVSEEKRLEEERIELNQKKYEAEVVIPARAEKEAAELKAKGKSARIYEDGRATAEAVKLMQAQWEDGNTRELFLIQMLPELLDRVTRVLADNLHIERLTLFDSGDGKALPTYMQNLTGSVITIIEQLKNATGLDLPGLLTSAAKNHTNESSLIPKEFKED